MVKRTTYQVVTYDVPSTMIVGITRGPLTLEEAHRIADKSNAYPYDRLKHPYRSVVLERP